MKNLLFIGLGRMGSPMAGQSGQDTSVLVEKYRQLH